MLGLYEVFYAGDVFIEVVSMAVFIYCVLSWFRPNFRAFYWLRSFVMPFVSPFQKLSLRVMRYFNAPIDFSFLFALIGFRIIRRLWWMLYALIARGMMRG